MGIVNHHSVIILKEYHIPRYIILVMGIAQSFNAKIGNYINNIKNCNNVFENLVLSWSYPPIRKLCARDYMTFCVYKNNPLYWTIKTYIGFNYRLFIGFNYNWMCHIFIVLYCSTQWHLKIVLPLETTSYCEINNNMSIVLK